MSAESNLVFIGVRKPVSEEEIGALELRNHPMIKQAMSHGLQFYWANFGADDPQYYLFIGKNIGTTGFEGQPALILERDGLDTIFSDVRSKLEVAQIGGDPSLYVRWLPDT